MIPKIRNCVEKLHVHSEKIESQTEKLAETICDSDTEPMAHMIYENEDVCDGSSVSCDIIISSKNLRLQKYRQLKKMKR